MVDSTAGTLKQISRVFKLRIAAAITLCAFAGMAITSGVSLAPGQVAVLAFAVFLSSAGASAFNQHFERELDAQMPRTRNRPFVTGEFQAGWLWLTGLGLNLALAVFVAAWVLNARAALYIFLGAFVYGAVYTVWLKRRSVWNNVIGGLAGSLQCLPELQLSRLIWRLHQSSSHLYYFCGRRHISGVSQSSCTKTMPQQVFQCFPLSSVMQRLQGSSCGTPLPLWSCLFCRWLWSWALFIWRALWQVAVFSFGGASNSSAIPDRKPPGRIFMPLSCNWDCCWPQQ
jgi:hypothetical protein